VGLLSWFITQQPAISSRNLGIPSRNDRRSWILCSLEMGLHVMGVSGSPHNERVLEWVRTHCNSSQQPAQSASVRYKLTRVVWWGKCLSMQCGETTCCQRRSGSADGEGSDLLLSSDRGAGGAVVSREEAPAGWKAAEQRSAGAPQKTRTHLPQE
jgi:hypothetical protein